MPENKLPVRPASPVAGQPVRALILCFGSLVRLIKQGLRHLADQLGPQREIPFRQLADAMPQIVWTARPDGYLDYYNERWYEYTGFDRHAGGDSSWLPIMPEEDGKRCLDAWYHSVRTGEPFEIEYRFRHAQSGQFRWHLGRALPIKDPDGNVVKWIGTCTDIHEQKETQSALQHSKQLMDAILNSLDIAVAEMDREGKYTFSAGGTHTKLGVDHAGRIGKSFREVHGTQPEVVEAIEKAFQGHSINFDRALGDHCFQSYLAPLKDSQGGIAGVIGFSVNVTETRKAHSKIQDLQDKLQVAMDHAPVILFTLDKSGTFTFVDGNGLKVAGRKHGQILGKNYKDIYQAYPQITKAITLALRGVAHTVEALAFGAWHEIHYQPIFAENGAVEGVAGVSTIITDRKTALQALESTRQKMNAIVSNSGILVWSYDEDGILEHLEGKALAHLGRDLHGMLGRSYRELAAGHPEIATAIEAAYRGANSRYEHQVFDRWFESLVSPVRNDEDAITGVIAVSVDISERKTHEQERAILKANEKAAQEASRMKSTFLANMSHEIRTPINGVIGMTGLLCSTTLTEEQREYADSIKSSANSLLCVINDILDFSKIEAGKLDFETLDFALPELLQELNKTFRHVANKKRIQFHSDIPAHLPKAVRGDPGRLRQVLTNLLSNAIKFTKEGQVTLAARPESLTQNAATIRFEIQDTGIGISPDNITRLFQPFCQAEAGTTRQFGGTGLGLSISQQLVRMMGGEISIESELGKGSKFTFSVRWELGTHVAVPEAEFPKAVRPARILVVEDNPINQKVAVKMLEKTGYYADAVGNGKEALAAIHELPYDLILMDCQMPEMDGYDATTAIRKCECRNGHLIPIIAMTANAMKGEQEKCLAVGMNDYVSKPISAANLARVIHRWLERPLLQAV